MIRSFLYNPAALMFNKKMITFNDHDVDLEIIPGDVHDKYKILFSPKYVPKILALLTTYINLNFKRN